MPFRGLQTPLPFDRFEQTSSLPPAPVSYLETFGDNSTKNGLYDAHLQIFKLIMSTIYNRSYVGRNALLGYRNVVDE